jgi:hypothetical protein
LKLSLTNGEHSITRMAVFATGHETGGVGLANDKDGGAAPAGSIDGRVSTGAQRRAHIDERTATGG